MPAERSADPIISLFQPTPPCGCNPARLDLAQRLLSADEGERSRRRKLGELRNGFAVCARLNCGEAGGETQQLQATLQMNARPAEGTLSDGAYGSNDKPAFRRVAWRVTASLLLRQPPPICTEVYTDDD